MTVEERIQRISIYTTTHAIPSEIILGLNLYKKNNELNSEMNRIRNLGILFCDTFNCYKNQTIDLNKCDMNLFLGFKEVFHKQEYLDQFDGTIKTLESVLIKIGNVEKVEDNTIERIKGDLNNFSSNASSAFISVDQDILGCNISV